MNFKLVTLFVSIALLVFFTASAESKKNNKPNYKQIGKLKNS